MFFLLIFFLYFRDNLFYFYIITKTRVEVGIIIIILIIIFWERVFQTYELLIKDIYLNLLELCLGSSEIYITHSILKVRSFDRKEYREWLLILYQLVFLLLFFSRICGGGDRTYNLLVGDISQLPLS